MEWLALCDARGSALDRSGRQTMTSARALPPTDDNDGDLPAGAVYTKYDWSLYHHENKVWGVTWGGGGVSQSSNAPHQR